MPTPHFTFRLARDKAEALHGMAKLYGSQNTSEFLRLLLTAVCSGDPQQVAEFNGRLFQKMGEQLTLKLVSAAAPQPAEKPARKRKVRRKGGKVRERT